MKRTLKNLSLKHNFRRIVYVVKRFIIFKYKKIVNIPFSLNLNNNVFIRMYPQGQISLPIYMGAFENDDINLFAEYIKLGMNVVDIGANVGLYSIIANSKICNDGNVWAFEPSLENYNCLLKNLSLNNCNNVTPVNFGLGNQVNQKLTLRMDAGHGDADKYIIPNNKLPDLNVNKIESSEDVILTTLDSYMAEVNNKKIDFIKIDAEGYEYYILQGAVTLLEANPDLAILLECTELGAQRCGYNQQDVYDLLKGFGLNLFYWDSVTKNWKDDVEGLKHAGNIWASKTIEQLPVH